MKFRIVFVGVLVGFVSFLTSCSEQKKKIGTICFTDVETKDTLFIIDWTDLNQEIEFGPLENNSNYDVAVLNLSTELTSLGMVVPMNGNHKNTYKLAVPESFLKGNPVSGEPLISFGGNDMLSDYNRLMTTVKQNLKDTVNAVNGFVRDLNEFSKKFPRSGMVGYHVYEAMTSGEFEDMSRNLDAESKVIWEKLSTSKKDVFSKELQRVKSSGISKKCKQHPANKLVFQSSNSTIHPDVLKDNMKVLIFWATWCGPCKVQIKQLAELNSSKYANDPVVFFGVTSESDHKMVFDWVDKNWKKYAGESVSVFHDDSYCMASNYQISQYPTIMVFDKNDQLVKNNCTVLDVEHLVDSLLAK